MYKKNIVIINYLINSNHFEWCQLRLPKNLLQSYIPSMEKRTLLLINNTNENQYNG